MTDARAKRSPPEPPPTIGMLRDQGVNDLRRSGGTRNESKTFLSIVVVKVSKMSRPFTKVLLAAFALGAIALSAEPASATPMSGAAAIELAKSAASAGTEQVYYRPGYRGRYRYGYRRPYRYRRGIPYHYRRGLPGHPVRRLLRAL